MKKGYFICMKLLRNSGLLLICLLSDIYGVSDFNSTTDSPIDSVHKSISSKVHKWAVDIDEAILGVYDFFDKNSTEPKKFYDVNTSVLPSEDVNSSWMDSNSSELEFYEDEKGGNTLSDRLKEKGDELETQESFDAFFLTRRELEERDESYVRIRISELVNSLDSEKTKIAIRAKLKLDRSKKKVKLIIEDLNDNSVQNIGRSDDSGSPAIGVERSSGKVFGIKPRYSIGFRGFDPFARARFYYEADIGKGWKFHPVQTFLYTVDEEFSELTELYLDKPTSENTLFRILLDRGTEDRVKGMRYDAYIQWFYYPREHAGLSLTLGANAHTHYEHEIAGTDPVAFHEANRVYNYLFAIRWRENIWKKWFFYDISPGVNYDKRFEYRANYNLTFRIEFFFGHV